MTKKKASKASASNFSKHDVKVGRRNGRTEIVINGQPITGQGSLIAVVRDSVPGDEIAIIVLRKGSRLTLTAKLVVRKSS